MLYRSVLYHRFSVGAAALGVATTSAVLVGALLVGDSVRHSLRHIRTQRLGKVHHVLSAGDRFFRGRLVTELAAGIEADIAGVVALRAVAVHPETSRQVGEVRLWGIDDAFHRFAMADATGFGVDEQSVVLNREVAARLGVAVGDVVVLRIDRPGAVHRDMSLSVDADSHTVLRLKVAHIIGAEDLGNMNLDVSQLPPKNAFVSKRMLQRVIDRDGRENMMLIARPKTGDLPVIEMRRLLRQVFTVEDAGLSCVATPDGSTQIETSRVFLPDSVMPAVRAVHPGARGFLTYFVTDLTAGDRSTPYSMVTAMSETAPGGDVIGPGEIVLSDWTAEDLGVSAGSQVTLRYFTADRTGSLRTAEYDFTVSRILPTASIAALGKLAPSIPGLSDEAHCSDWNLGVPIDLERIRDHDEDYWQAYGPTPKALISLETGQRIWRNRFGSLTAIRISSAGENDTDVCDRLATALDPAALGFAFVPVRDLADAAVVGAVDFSMLFAGLSFFLIVGALCLTGLLFQLGLDRRAGEQAALKVLGFPPSWISRYYLIESLFIAFPAVAIGAVLGVGYMRIMASALSTVWSGAAGSATILPYTNPGTLVLGAALSLGAVTIVVYAYLCRIRRVPPAVALRGAESGALWTRDQFAGQWRRHLLIAVGSGILAAFMPFQIQPEVDPSGAIGFMVSGALWLVCGLASAAGLFRYLATCRTGVITPVILGIRNLGRCRNRSMAVVAMVACGTFLLIALESQRLTAGFDDTSAGASTGGYRLIAEMTLPVYPDGEPEPGDVSKGWGLDGVAGDNMAAIQILDGDDASCLNLSQAQQPRVVGIDPDQFTDRPFSFASTLADDNAGPWHLLSRDYGDNVIPVVTDKATMLYALKRRLGDTLEHRDDRGNIVKFKLVATLTNSIFQGVLIADAARLRRSFSTVAGYRMLLVDVPADAVADVSAALIRRYATAGVEISETRERLELFNRVQNTYITIFQVLGGLGLLLGTIGLGIIIFRNVLERESELAILTVIGFKAGMIRRLVLSENVFLLLIGLGCGLLSSLVAILPLLLAPGATPPWLLIAGVVVGLFLGGVVWTWTATCIATRRELISALRRE